MDEFQQRIQTLRSDVDTLPNMVADLMDAATVDQAKEDILTKLRLIRVGEIPGEIDTRETRAAATKVGRITSAFENLLQSAVGGPMVGDAFAK